MKTPIQILKSKGYDDDCTPNYLSEIADLMKAYAKPYKVALDLIAENFPEEVLMDQLGEDYDKVRKVLTNKIK